MESAERSAIINLTFSFSCVLDAIVLCSLNTILTFSFIIISLSFIRHTIYNNVGSYHFYLGNRQMSKCAPNLELCSYKLFDK